MAPGAPHFALTVPLDLKGKHSCWGRVTNWATGANHPLGLADETLIFLPGIARITCLYGAFKLADLKAEEKTLIFTVLV